MMFKFKTQKTSMSARAGIIKEAGFRIPTPLRVINSKEIEHASKITNSGLVVVAFPHPVAEVSHYIKTDSLYSILSNAEASKGLMNQVVSKSKKSGNRLTLFHGAFEKALDVTDRMNRVLIDLQIQSDIDAVSIIDRYNSSPIDFENRLLDSMRQIETSGSPSEPMPTIRMDTDEKTFAPKLKMIHNHGINILNLTYAPIKENLHNYSFLIKYMIDKNIWIHMSELGDKILNKSSLIHTMPLYCIDSFSLKSRPIPLGNFKKVTAMPKRFDSITLGHIDTEEHKKRYGNQLKCKCSVDSRKKLNDFINVFNGAQLLRQAIACHNTTASYNEFSKARESIMGDDYREYLSKKIYMHKPIKKLFKIDLSMRPLI